MSKDERIRLLEMVELRLEYFQALNVEAEIRKAEALRRQLHEQITSDE